MPIAVGTIQTLGFPPVLAAADAMVKAGAVTLVNYDLAESGQFYVTIRGAVGEVERAMEAGLAAAKAAFGGNVVNYYIIPHPTENVETAMDINYTEASEAFRFF